MPIKEFIERAQILLRQGVLTSEAAVTNGILLPVLQELGWPVFDTTVVVPQYSVEGRRVDFALCHPPNRPAVFVEVKKTGLSEGADRQWRE
jgi:predicted type IV restriction endonuclease